MLKLEKSRAEYVERHWKAYQCEISNVATVEDDIDLYTAEVTKFELELKQKETKRKTRERYRANKKECNLICIAQEITSELSHVYTTLYK